MQDLIETKEIEFDPPKTPNVITTPMPKNDPRVSVIDVVSAAEEADNNCDIDKWIFPTISGGLNN